MTATDALRALLDERGVRWWEEDGHTLWYGESIHHAASAFSSFMFGENERVHLNAMVTPEQAVEATLGSDLEAENAELRELVRIMHGELVSCEDNGYVCGGHKFDERVRELGIEVDA